MTASLAFDRIAGAVGRTIVRISLPALFAVIAACGSGDAPPPPEIAPTAPPAMGPVAPTITQQPAAVTTMPGQPASFSVTATGTAPLAYQWQRGGVAIVGATSATYALPTTAVVDSGSTFRVVVSNVAGSATSDDAVLTVTAATPVLTISPQPVSQTVSAGAPATFTVGGTCSSATLTIQWQRSSGNATAFVDIPGANATRYTFMAAAGDNAALFRAVLSCSGQVATASDTAMLTVVTSAVLTLSEIPVVGLRDQAPIGGTWGIDPTPGGGWDFTSSNAVRHLSADLSTITLVAGGSDAGSTDGPSAAARFAAPSGVVHDAAGVAYVTDTTNHTIRRIAPDGTVSTLAGTAGMAGASDGSGAAARFSVPFGIAIGPDGDLYVADGTYGTIRRVTTAGVVTTYAGSGSAGYADGPAASAQFRAHGIAVAPNGDVYLADTGNSRIRRIARSGTSAGMVTTFAGNGSSTTPGPDGVGIAAGVPYPQGLLLRGTTLYVSDLGGTIRTIDLTTAAVTTFTGSPALGHGYADGAPGQARFDNGSSGIAAAANGGLIVSDEFALRRVDAAGNVVTIAAAAAAALNPDTAGVGVLTQLPLQTNGFATGSVVVDPAGRLFVTETTSKLVRAIDTGGDVSTVAGLATADAVVDGVGDTAQFSQNSALALAPGGNLYVGDQYTVRRILADGTTTTIGGSPTAYGGIDGPTGTSRFFTPSGLAVLPNGDVLVGDAGNNAVRRIDGAGNATTFAGVIGSPGTADGPRTTSALFRTPGKLAVAPDGSVYVADGPYGGASALRRIAADGTVTTIVVNVFDVTVDLAGNVYVAYTDAGVQSLGSIDPVTGAVTRLVSTSAAVQLGSMAPSLGPVIGSISAKGVKQIVVAATSGRLLLVTLP